MRLLRGLGFAGALVTAALVGGTLIGAASAAPGGTAPGTRLLADEHPAGEYCEVFQEAFAAELGTTTDALVPAAKAAALATIDAAVANGDLPEAMAERIREHVASAEGDGCALLAQRWQRWGHHAARGAFLFDLLGAAAGALEMTPHELRTELGERSLSEIAEAQGVDYATVSAAVLDAARADLDAAVESGRIDEARADRVLERIESWLDDGGQPRDHGPRHRDGDG